MPVARNRIAIAVETDRNTMLENAGRRRSISAPWRELRWRGADQNCEIVRDNPVEWMNHWDTGTGSNHIPSASATLRARRPSLKDPVAASRPPRSSAELVRKTVEPV